MDKGLADFGKSGFLTNGGSTKSLKRQITGTLSQKNVSSMKDCLRRVLVEIHFFFLNVVDFFQKIFHLDFKQLNLVRLQFLKNLCSSAVFLDCESSRLRLKSIQFMCFFKK